MYLNNVFYGFTKDGVDRLLWKKYKTIWTSLGEVTMTIYYDLNSKEEIETNFVDASSLKPITNLVGEVKWMRRKKVKAIYNADRNFLIDVTGAYYGVIIEKIKTSFAIKKFELRDNVLFARINDPEGRSMEVKTGNLYPKSEYVYEGLSVKESRPIKREHFDNVVAPKRKLLELDYRKEL